MAGIHKVADLLREHGNRYLVLDFNHLFVASTLREEVWLLRQRDDKALAEEVIRQAGEFGIQGAACDRDLATYSGGEQAIIACLLTLAVIRASQLRGVRIILYDILNSLSPENRAKLLALFAEAKRSHDLSFLVADNGHLREVEFDDHHWSGNV